MNDPGGQVESLLRLAGERDQPRAESMERARAAARLSWERGLKRETVPRRPWRAMGWAMAASLALVTAAVFWPRLPAEPAIEVARVAASTGEVRLSGSGPAVSPGAVLHGGQVLGTAEGRVALAMGDALSLRLDRHTRLKFDGVDQVTLLEGSVYVDSGGLNSHPALRIHTPAGAVRHVGTQFQVAVRGEATRVQVREGRVVVMPAQGAALELGAGDLAQGAHGKLDVLHGQPASGESWEWAAATAPPFDIENRPLSEFLAWLAREHGWQLRYADASVQSRARDIRLHGSLANLEADAMLERASLITGVPLSVQDGSLRVGTNP